MIYELITKRLTFSKNRKKEIIVLKLSFKGGVHPPQNKNTAHCAVETLPPSKMVHIPLSQHIGGVCTPLVKKGDIVDKGQIIGDVESGLGCPVHASVSGVVDSIEIKTNAAGQKMGQIAIINDFEERLSKDITPIKKPLAELTFEDVVEMTRKAGIVGMGGATFPTYAKLSSAKGKIKHLIINCAECEPYITVNHRLLLEQPERVLNGLKILLKVFGLPKGYIAIEDNKPDAIELLNEKTEGSDLVDICVMKTKYPQGDERQIIYALTGKELTSGHLPFEVGCLILNAETVAAIYDAVVYGMPVIERFVTVDGDCIREPKNLKVRIGTPINELIDYCGGLISDPHKIICGGPMMGIAQWKMYAPTTKGTSSVIVFSQKNRKRFTNTPSCIHCGRCVGHCPMHLMPNYLVAFANDGQLDKCRQFDILGCVECGSCSYDCPADVPIVQTIRAAKGKILEEMRAQKAALNKSAVVAKEEKEEKGDKRVEH